MLAVTGGIASGKTAVTDHLSRLGVPVIDADLVSRELVAPGQPALAEIAQRFGEGVLDQHGALHRTQLRQRIFADPLERKALEAILHPRVRTRMRQRAESIIAPLVALAIPLLTETGAYAWVDRIVVVDAPESLQIARLMRRDGVDHAQALQTLAAQASRLERLALASDVLINDGSLDLLFARTDKLYRQLLDQQQP